MEKKCNIKIYILSKKIHMNHPKTIEKYAGSLKQLSRDIVNLEYDALVELFITLKEDFGIDAINDKKINHPQVSGYLKGISEDIQQTLEKNMQPMANICRWYNKKGIK